MALGIDDGHGLSVLVPFRVTGSRSGLPKSGAMGLLRRYLERRRVLRLLAELESIARPPAVARLALGHGLARRTRMRRVEDPRIVRSQADRSRPRPGAEPLDAQAARGSVSGRRARATPGTSGDSSSCRLPPALVERELTEDRAAPPASTPARRRATARRATSAAPRSQPAFEDAAHDELRRDRAVPAVLLEPERDVEAAVGPAAARAAPPRPNAIALPASRPCWRTRNRRCFPSPTVAGADGLAAGDEQRHIGVAEPERARAARAPAPGRASAPRPGTIASIARHRARGRSSASSASA